MKNLILFAIALFFLFNYGNSQTIKSLSVSGGYTLASQNMEVFGVQDIAEEKPIGGWGVDIGLGLWQNKNFVVSTHVGLIKKGVQLPLSFDNAGSPSTETNTRYRFNYLYLAPRLSFRKQFKHFTPFVFIAPRADFYVSYNRRFFHNGVEIYNSRREPDDREKQHYRENHNPIVFGSTFGLGIEKKIFNKVAVGIETAYWLDINKAIEFTNPVSNPGETPSGNRITNRAFTVFATVRYNFAKG